MRPTRSLVLPVLLALVAPVSLAQMAAYHDATGAYHQGQHDSLKPQGFRMVTLTMYGDPGTPTYAALWEKRSGPPFQAFRGLDLAGYQSFFGTWSQQGYQPTMLTATGSGASTRMSGVFEQIAKPFWALHDLDYNGFRNECGKAINQGYRLVAAATWGTLANPRFAGVWRQNDEKIDWGWVFSANGTEYQTHYNAFRSAWVRPAFVTTNAAGQFLSIWHDDQIGEWSAYHGLTSAQYQTTFTNEWNDGAYPLCLQAAGTGANARFAAIFVKSETVVPRGFATTGQAVAELAAFDTYVKNLMQTNNVRAAALAVAKDGRLMLARGYTNAEPGYPVTQPTSLFRIASASKSLTSISVHRQYDRTPALTETSAMLPYFEPVTELDPLTAQVRMVHLLTHSGGWNTSVLNFDPVFFDKSIADALSISVPVNKPNIFQYMTTQQMLQFSPGTSGAYSNYGFMIAGRVLERLNPGMTYAQVVQRDVFTPVGVTRARIGGSLLAAQAAGEVRYHPRVPYIAPSVHAAGQPIVAGQYGGWNQANLDSCGGWVLAAPDYAKVLAAFDLDDGNPILSKTRREQMWSSYLPNNAGTLRGWFKDDVMSNGKVRKIRHHNGGLPGTATICARREDGMSFVLFFNRDSWLGGSPHAVAMSAIADGIATWPNHDLFPSVGLPSLRSYTAGTMTPFGISCAGSKGTPSHSGAGVAELDKTVSLRLASAQQNAAAVMFLGFSKSFWGPFPLPIGLAGFGAPGCLLYVPPVIALTTATNAQGAAELSVTIPDDAGLIGQRFYTQFGCFDLAANQLGFTFTNGLDTKVGGWK